MNMFISTWVLLVAGLIFALPMIHMRVKDTTDDADETLCVVPSSLLIMFRSPSVVRLALSLSTWRRQPWHFLLPSFGLRERLVIVERLSCFRSALSYLRLSDFHSSCT